MLFGASCSAQYVKDKNAQEHLETYTEAANAILEYHYVDDFVMSFETKEKAVQITKQVREIHLKGGFLLTKFTSNSNDVLEELVGGFIPNHEINMNIYSDEFEKLLGLHWDRSRDCFKFKSKLTKIPYDVLQEVRKPTKREVLKIVMSIYDPFGFFHYFLIVCKILLQEIWKENIKWDQRISNEHYHIWKNWQRQLKNIENIEIPRQFFSFNITETKTLELHVFTDASAKAYCAVVYARCKRDDQFCVSFIMSKIKVAPISKVTSIPRLELSTSSSIGM